MKKKLWQGLLILAGMAVELSAFAADGNITGITVTPANPKPNQAVTVTVQGTVAPGKKCTILFLKGDGTAQSQVGHAASFPFTFGGQAYPLFTYKNPGTYTIKVYPSPTQKDAKCTGQGQATVTVAAPTSAPQMQMAPAVFATNPCPTGWHLKQGNATGAYTCVPNKPAKGQCPPKHEWFETECAVGCRQLIY